jgi:alpha-glucosidase
LASRDGARDLAADTGAVAHVFVLEEDMIRVLLLAMARHRRPAGPSRRARRHCRTGPRPDEHRGLCHARFRARNRQRHRHRHHAPRLAIAREGFLCTWQAGAEGWQLIAQDRPTQAYNFGWWDEGVYHYVQRQPGERYYALGERAGAMDRAGRRFRLTNLDPMGYDAAATTRSTRRSPMCWW